MKNREKVERVYSEIHAPEALVWKVMDMSKTMETKKFKTRNVVKYAVCTLAIMAMTFMASNGICYAATGESLVTKIKVTINGEEKQEDINWTKEGDTYQGTVTIPGEDGSETTVTIDAESTEAFNTDIIIESGDRVDENGMEVEKSVTLEVRDGENADAVTYENEVEEK